MARLPRPLRSLPVPNVRVQLPTPQRIRVLARAARARTRRAGVRVLTRAATIPVVRPVAEVGFRTLFDSLAGNWEAIRADPAYRAGFEEALTRLPRGFRPRRALDVACGTGVATGLLLERWPGLAVIGTDISPRMVQIATELVPDASFAVASVHRLPYADGEFDLVTALDGLLDPSELLRVLHRKGRLLVVYSKAGTTPISRPLAELAHEFRAAGAIADPHDDGMAHVLVVRHTR